MANSADLDQLASSSQLIWIYTVCKGRTYPGTAGQGLMHLQCINYLAFFYRLGISNTKQHQIQRILDCCLVNIICSNVKDINVFNGHVYLYDIYHVLFAGVV